MARIPNGRIISSLLLAWILHGNLGAEGFFPSKDPGEFRIAAYNVENYTSMPRRIDGKLAAEAGKPEPERNAVARSIAEISPDVIGLMEVGSPVQFQDLRRRLHKAGLDYAQAEYLSGPDQSRHVALLSRFPIVESHSAEDIPLRVGPLTLHSPRGLLDVTVEPCPGYRIRVLCVHLKAKLEVADYDASALREAEASFLRKHIREILSRDPATRLVVMGDFNDTKNSRTLLEIAGKPDRPDSMRALPLNDRNGESWTEYWESADVYSRIDYMMVSKKLEQEIDSARSAVARFPFWKEASDHCPLVLTLKNRLPETASCASPLPSP
jgi:endonuclease/exonuclease/phosphatase family metal-dependent hydrolase